MDSKLELRVVECRSGLMVYQERILAKSGKYKIPETVEEAKDMKFVLPQNAREALETISEAHNLINELYELNTKLAKAYHKGKAEIAKQKLEMTKQRIELDKLKKQNEEFSKTIFTEADKPGG
jgi:hypothetical protein